MFCFKIEMYKLSQEEIKRDFAKYLQFIIWQQNKCIFWQIEDRANFSHKQTREAKKARSQMQREII